MKLVTAVVQQTRVDEVRQSLTALGVRGMTIADVQGYGRQQGHTEIYRGAEYKVDVVDKTRVEVLVNDVDADEVLRAIVSAARSGRVGDGKVWVTPVESVVRVRTGETGEQAI
ncbi:nitrogen regulatory protein P-II family [Actinopolyspora xinjiangensis]|uniref:Nitrogen regulatory protein P-II n=1 Tax=Actinopolyspora xinjiangensis TaxID=405564 RepID=A0A1H0T1F1_9ACTN|nr:P-II family nitrogen regulator [Actinopolyspora xinjiangensis]SDP47764.1 nitrogen regulatory protein P-II family [Actinopolyspora xinjiangensis]